MTSLDWIDLACDRVDPPSGDPTSSPLAYGVHTGRGLYHRAAHLELLEAAVLETLETGGNLIIELPVRHGKSDYVSRRLPAWLLGKHPDKRVLLATHGADFARTHGRWIRDNLTEYGPELFGVRVAEGSSAADQFDLQGHPGGLVALGVGGSPIGRGGDVVIIDDPYGSYEDAMSPTIRAKVIDWWTGTMVSRREPGCATFLICSRWHEDDLPGFLQREEADQWKVLHLPALCDDPDNDELGRSEGEALWPERWPVEELEKRRRSVSLSLGDAVWLAQYQQTPHTPGGSYFPPDRWNNLQVLPVPLDQVRWCRGWDLAASEGKGDWTAGVLLGWLPDGRFVVADAKRDRLHSDEVRTEMLLTKQSDPPGTHIEIPQDPGQAGKDQAGQLVRMLAGSSVQARPQSGSKELRASGFSAQQRAGNVWILGDLNGNRQDFVNELQQFPKGAHDDQVDACSSAFAGLIDPPTTATLVEYDEDDDTRQISPY